MTADGSLPNNDSGGGRGFLLFNNRHHVREASCVVPKSLQWPLQVHHEPLAAALFGAMGFVRSEWRAPERKGQPSPTGRRPQFTEVH